MGTTLVKKIPLADFVLPQDYQVKPFTCKVMIYNHPGQSQTEQLLSDELVTIAEKERFNMQNTGY